MSSSERVFQVVDLLSVSSSATAVKSVASTRDGSSREGRELGKSSSARSKSSSLPVSAVAANPSSYRDLAPYRESAPLSGISGVERLLNAHLKGAQDLLGHFLMQTFDAVLRGGDAVIPCMEFCVLGARRNLLNDPESVACYLRSFELAAGLAGIDPGEKLPALIEEVASIGRWAEGLAAREDRLQESKARWEASPGMSIASGSSRRKISWKEVAEMAREIATRTI